MTYLRFTLRSRKKPSSGESWTNPDVVTPSYTLVADDREEAEAGNNNPAADVTVGFRKRKLSELKTMSLAKGWATAGYVTAGRYSHVYVISRRGSAGSDATYFGKSLYRSTLLKLNDVAQPAYPTGATTLVSEDFIKRLLGDLVEQKFAELLGQSNPVPDALASARSRGGAYKKAELAKPENAPLKDASIYAGTSDRTINKWRQEGSLYALVQEGKARGYRYPLWQFDADRARLCKALRPFREANTGPWVIHNFFQRPHSSLDGRTPREWVLDHNADIDRLVRMANEHFAGDQGAT